MSEAMRCPCCESKRPMATGTFKLTLREGPTVELACYHCADCGASPVLRDQIVSNEVKILRAQLAAANEKLEAERGMVMMPVKPSEEMNADAELESILAMKLRTEEDKDLVFNLTEIDKWLKEVENEVYEDSLSVAERLDEATRHIEYLVSVIDMALFLNEEEN